MGFVHKTHARQIIALNETGRLESNMNSLTLKVLSNEKEIHSGQYAAKKEMRV